MNNFLGFINCRSRQRQRVLQWVLMLLLVVSVLRKVFRVDKSKSSDSYVVRNFFEFNQTILENQLLVDSPGKCQIPELDWWSEEIREFIHPVSKKNCSENLLHISDTKGDKIYINITLLNELSYEFDDVSCCYRSIRRMEMSSDNFDSEADKKFTISKNCSPLQEVTVSQWRFIKVECTDRKIPRRKPFYFNFHVLPVLPEEEDVGVRDKIEFWRKCSKGETFAESDDSEICSSVRKVAPPNVLLLGIDSTSRINLHRFMNKTISVLERMGAVEMLGYTKVGDNTFPNFIPIMTSMSQEEIEEVCSNSSSQPLDSCPFLWKQFSRLKYLTGHLEDTPTIAIFNFEKMGFVKSPVDIYLRAFMLALYDGKNGFGPSWSTPCVGYERPEEVVLEFISDLLRSAAANNVPSFITTWLTDLTHENTNDVQRLDRVLANALHHMEKMRLLENTITFIISDHGYRFTGVRQTFSGWYEDKLPALWIHLPEKVKNNHPQWFTALKNNSKLLTSPFDIYATLRHILMESYSPMAFEWGKDTVPWTRGQSLFRQSQPRSCSEAGIPGHFCACQIPVHIETNLSIVHTGGQAVADYINSQIPSECVPLQVSSIMTSGIIRATDSKTNSTDSKTNSTDSKTNSTDSKTNSTDSKTNSTDPISPHDSLIIGIKTTPGVGEFEGRVEFNWNSSTFSNVTGVVRTNSLQRAVSCLKKRKYFHTLLCYCP